MKLQYVKLKNFKSYPDQETTIDLSFDGIKLLIGENGDGKSTFFDAIVWCFYGKNKDGVDGVVNRKTRKNCKVEVGFKVGNSNYSIVRYRSHETNGNKLLFFKEKKNLSQRTAGATQELIDNTIEIQYNTMISSIVLSSESYTSFLRSSRSERLKTIESILSLKDITLFYNKLKKLKDPVDEKVSTLNLEKEKSEVSITSLTDNIDEYKEGVKKTLLEYKRQKERLQDEVFKLTNKISEYDCINIEKEIDSNKEYDVILERNRALNGIILRDEAKIVNINELVTLVENNNSEINDLESVDIQKELVMIKEFEDVTANNLKVEGAIGKLEAGVRDTNSLSRNVKVKKNNITSVETNISAIKEHMDKCPTCNQPVEEKLTLTLIENKNKELEVLRSSLLEVEGEIKAIEKKNTEIEAALVKLNNMIKPVVHPSHKKEYLLEVKDKIKDLKNKNLLVEKDIENGELTNKDLKKLISDNRNERTENENRKKEPEYHTVFLNDLKEKIVTLRDETEEKRQEILTIDVQAKSSYDKGYIDNTLETIKKMTKTLTKTRNALEKAMLDKKHYEALLTVFSNKDSGFKKFFINKVISVFNDRINFYLPFFFEEEMVITFDKDLNETIKLDKEEVTFASFSSGQKTRFDIAISFSLFMMVKMFFSSTINLLVFDEILDMNLDKKGFNSVHEIIENLGDHNTVFVVSHQEFYKEKFNHHIHVKRNKDGFSYIHSEV